MGCERPGAGRRADDSTRNIFRFVDCLGFGNESACTEARGRKIHCLDLQEFAVQYMRGWLVNTLPRERHGFHHAK